MDTPDIRLYKSAFDSALADRWFEALLHGTNWHKELRMVKTGEMATIPRRMAYIADEPIMYRYDKYELPGDVWNETLLEIKKHVEEKTGERFNSVLLNLYEDGKDGIGWHSDKERQLGQEPFIACLNLGAGRIFSFKRKRESEMLIEHWVENGDLLVMDRQCQRNWLHAILENPKVTEPRISLTWRWVYPIDESGIALVNILSDSHPLYDLYIGRANYDLGLGGSKWGNPFKLKNESQREEVLAKYREHVLSSPELLAALPELQNLTLGCYCAPHKRCHGNVLIDLFREFVTEKSKS